MEPRLINDETTPASRDVLLFILIVGALTGQGFVTLMVSVM